MNPQRPVPSPVSEAISTTEQLVRALVFEAAHGPTQIALVTPENAEKTADALLAVLSALKVRTEALRPLASVCELEVREDDHDLSKVAVRVVLLRQARAALTEEPSHEW